MGATRSIAVLYTGHRACRAWQIINASYTIPENSPYSDSVLELARSQEHTTPHISAYPSHRLGWKRACAQQTSPQFVPRPRLMSEPIPHA